MNPVLIALAVVVVFGVLVTMHEFGHFIVAKLNGVKVLEFNVGFGQPILSVTRGETRYALRVIPLGGYVRLAGMDDGDDSPRSFNRKPVWRRLTIISAGSITNLLLPIPIFLVAGLALQGGPLTVVSLLDKSPAASAGIPLNAQVRSLNGREVGSANELRRVIRDSGGREVAVEYRDPGSGSAVTKHVVPVLQQGHYRIGVGTTGGGYDLLGTLGDSVIQDKDAILATLGGFVSIVTGHIPGGLGGNCGPSGPVGIVRATAAAASAGWISLLQFMAFLSVNLGILNLLPLPALDGGRLAFLVVEGVRRKPVDPSKEQRVHYAGLLVLLAFVLFITFNDVARLGVPFSQLLNQCAG
ncbi:MAG: M50 family metallopeptidase [Candidatus Dormibacteraeota bacterium]|nr:M50 family metallopeptidase [Candidatus Dormibacteraeota bacterium]